MIKGPSWKLVYFKQFLNKFKDLYNSVGFESRDLETLMSKLNKLINKDHTGHRLNTNIIKNGQGAPRAWTVEKVAWIPHHIGLGFL